MQAVEQEVDLWEVELPLWKRIPAHCSTAEPHALRFTGDAVYGGYIAFRARLAPDLPDAAAAAEYAAPLLVTLAAADGSMDEVFAHLDRCACFCMCTPCWSHLPRGSGCWCCLFGSPIWRQWCVRACRNRPDIPLAWTMPWSMCRASVELLPVQHLYDARQ